MAETPIQLASRIKLLGAFTGDVRVFKQDDAAETMLVAVKTATIDADNVSFYVTNRDTVAMGKMTYLGTTQLGKDGGWFPVIFRTGLVGVFLCEVPIASGPGSSAELVYETLQYRVPAGLMPSATDAIARADAKAALDGFNYVRQKLHEV